MKINIIADIAGRYDELQALLQKMPEADLILSVGDMMDRGPKSKEVIEWFMQAQKAGRAEAIYGNHEDLMVQAITKGQYSLWTYNGGSATLLSYKHPDQSLEGLKASDIEVDPAHIEWLQQRPMYFQTDDLFVSHAPVQGLKYIPSDPYSRDHNFIWNRWVPSKPQDKFMVHGHNGEFREYKWGDGSVYGVCIDNCFAGELRGMHWPSKEYFTVDYFDKKPD
jgi:serine/threonine protein phosphatase 1